ncbi:MAG: MMPL family transporter [Halieaceae bacterium]|nr:MMPL family transporter [Halieaceae bacterium]
MEKQGFFYWVESLIEIIIKKRWLFLVISVAATIVMSSGLRHVGLNHSYKAYIAEDSWLMRMIGHIEANYVKEDNIFVVIRPNQGDVFQPEVMDVVREFTFQAWSLSHAIRVDSLTNYQHTHAEGDELIVDSLVPEDLDLTPEVIKRVREIALTEPTLRGLYVAEDAKATGINIFFQYNDQNPVENLTLEQEFRKFLAEFKSRYPNIQFRHAGLVTAHADTILMAMHDIQTLGVMAGIGFVLGIYICLRSWLFTFACLAVIAFTVLSTMGIVSYAGVLLTLPTSSAPIMIMTLAAADSIHVLITVQRLLNEGMEKHEAIKESYRQNFIAIAATTITTMIGFMSFNTSSFAPLVELGNIVSGGIFLAFAYSLVFLPALLAIFPLHTSSVKRNPFIERFTGFIVKKIIRHRIVLVALTGVISIACIALAPNNKVVDSYVWFFPKDATFRQGVDFIEEHLSGSNQLVFSIEKEGANEVLAPAFMQRVTAFTQWLETVEGVRYVYAFDKTLRRINMNMHGDDPAFYKLPENVELAAQYALLYELSLPFGLDSSTQLNGDKSGLRIVASIENMDATRSYQRTNRILERLEQDFPDAETYYSGGTATMNYLIYETLMESIATSFVAFAAIGILLMFVFRSFLLGFIGMLGVVMPITVFFGLWAVFVGEIGMAASIVLGVALGIVVDNSVHLISKYNYSRLVRNTSAVDAVRYSLQSVAPALIVNTLVLGLGFYILSFADYGPNSTLGLMSSITFVVALVVCFTLVAPLLTFLRTKVTTRPRRL